MTESRPATDKKLKIFISYSRKDMDFAGRLEAALKARGIECLIDRTEIYAFEDWWKRIQALIIQTDTVIFILSPDAIASDVCKKEIKFAASLNKRFAPIVHRRVDVEAVPMELAQLNFVFFDDETAFDASVDRLTDALKTNIDWVRRHTNLGASARAWDGAKRPNGLLLRSPALEEAEQWIASRPPGAPEPTPETRSFIANSRTASTRRRNIIAASSLAGLVLAVALAIFANWQRQKAAVSEEAAQLARIEAEKKRDDALRSESLALGTQAISAITGDQKIKAFQLASAGLPRLWAQPD